MQEISLGFRKQKTRVTRLEVCWLGFMAQCNLLIDPQVSASLFKKKTPQLVFWMLAFQ